MKKFLSSLLLALTVLIAASPVYADGESISSVTVVGATEQNGTPTPTNPVNIVVNNGVVKVNAGTSVVNAIDFSDVVAGYLSSAPGSAPYISPSNDSQIIKHAIKVKAGKSYKFSYISNLSGNREQNLVGSDGIVKVKYNFNCSTGFNEYTITPQYDGELWLTVQSGDLVTVNPICYEIGSIYTEGAGETVRDSANHTANVETLFAVGDYADEQNINTGVITRKVGVKVLDGTENWNAWRNGYTTVVLRSIARAKTVPLSNITESVLSKIELDGSADLNFYNIVTDFPTVTDWKRYLATQYAAGTPVIIVYPLATETTENVTAQTMTTAPVIQNNGTIATTIRTLLQNGQTLVSNSLELGIRIATTAYNDAQFAPVEQALESAVTTIKDVVANTIVQADAIQNLQDTKQTMPDASGTNGTCPKFRQCLLIETDDGTPQWFQIADPVYDLISSLKNNKVNSSGETTSNTFAADGKTDPDSRYYNGYPAMRLKTSAASSAVNTHQLSSTLLNGANGGQYKTLGDQEWAVTWDGNETGTANSFLPGVIYGTSRCVKTSEAPTTTYAAKVNPGTAGWTLVENSDALNDLEHIEQYKSCFCKMTGVGLDGMITPVRDSSQAPWVFDYTNGAAGDCASHCAYYCAFDVRNNASFRQSLMGWAVE